MKIEAEGARRRSRTHNVVDDEFETVSITNSGQLKIKVRTDQDPGIGTGLYDLTIEFSAQEIFKLYNQAIIADHHVEIRGLKNRLSKLERASKSTDTGNRGRGRLGRL